MTIKAIIFDLGGVVIEFDFTKFFKEVIEISPLSKPHSLLLLEFWRQSDLYHQGKMSNEEFYHHTCELLQVCTLNQDEFFESFNSVISRPNNDVIELLKKLKNRNSYKLLALSNINESHANYLKKMNWNFLDIFDTTIFSYQIKMTKPDPRVFQYAIEKAGCKPEEIIYIDDGLNNIRSAKGFGLIGIHYSGLNELINNLNELKIL